MFETTDDLRKLAVQQGLLGSELEPALKVLRDSFAAKATALEARYNLRLNPLKEHIEALKQRRERLSPAAAEIERLQNEQEVLEAERAELSEALATLREEIRIRHREERIRRWQQLREEYHDQLERTPFLALEEEAFVAREIARHRRELWELDRVELDRRRTVLERDLERVEAELEVARTRVERLKQRHVTKTTSGFLIWAGYASFAAVGAIVGHLLQFSEGGDPLARALQAMAQRASGLSERPFVALLLFLGILVGTLLLIACLTWATDWLLQRFDRGWKPPLGKRRKRKSQRRTEQAALLGLPRGEVRRSTYVQLIASFPLAFVGALGIFFLGWGQSEPDGLSYLTRGLASSYLGAAFALLAASVALLYTLFVTMPRWFADSSDGGKGIRARGKAIEILVLAGLLPLALLGAAAAGDWEPERLAWSLVALFMVASSLALAHGIATRGFFRDLDVLERSRSMLSQRIELLNTQPILGFDAFEDLEPIRESFVESRAQQEQFDLASLLYFDPENEEGTAAPSFSELWFWLQRGRLTKDVREALKAFSKRRRQVGRSPSNEPSSGADPETLELRKQIAAIDIAIRSAIRRREQWQQAAPPQLMADLDVGISRTKLELLAAENEQLREQEQLTTALGRSLLEFESSYHLGRRTRDVLQLVDSQPPMPGSGGGNEEVLPS